MAAPVAAAGALAAAVLAGGGGSASDDPPRSAAPHGTEIVERRTLVEREQVDGTLGYGDPRPALDRVGGTLTWLPEAGAVIRPGERLFAVDDLPVVLMDGTVPAWRTLEAGMSDGSDVLQLERNLAALGHDPGTVDDAFTSVTAAAVERWQEANGLPETGRVELGRVVFLPGPRRVASVTGTLGSSGGAGGGGGAGTGDVAWDGGGGSARTAAWAGGAPAVRTASWSGDARFAPVADSGGATPSVDEPPATTPTTPSTTPTAPTDRPPTQTTPSDGTDTPGGGRGGGDGRGGSDGGRSAAPNGDGRGDGDDDGRGGDGRDGGSGDDRDGGSDGDGRGGDGGGGSEGDGRGDGDDDGRGGDGRDGGSGDDRDGGSDGDGRGGDGDGGGRAPPVGGSPAGGGSPITGGSPTGGGGSPGGSSPGGDDGGSGGGSGRAGTEVLETTSTERVVTAELDAADQALARVGRAATVTLPSGRTVRGRIVAVGTVATDSGDDQGGGAGGGGGGDGAATLPVTIRLRSARGAGGLDEAPVSVALARTTRRDVLAVPVQALVARSGGGYAVRVARRGGAGGAVEVPVEPGLYADGLVELLDGDVRPGDRVEVPR